MFEKLEKKTELSLRARVAMALFNKGVVLGELGRQVEARNVFEKIIGKFRSDKSTTIQQIVAEAQKGINH